ncbi:hypothetical protein [Streptomyces goshikiensis]|uniref:hypothetical protein n=1 Tax=Streptomyces goshikiensis TaxID=1942 RepID=UPI00365CD7B3
MTDRPPLWLPHEQAYTPDPPTADERAFTDIHGQQPRPRAYRNVVTVGSIDDYQPQGDHPMSMPPCCLNAEPLLVTRRGCFTRCPHCTTLVIDDAWPRHVQLHHPETGAPETGGHASLDEPEAPAP